MDEYSPADEIGIPEDRQFVSSCHGLITTNNNARNLCARYMDRGERIFDILSRYEEVSIYTSKTAKEGASRELMKILVPLLKASGVTDHGAYSFGMDDIRLMPGADKTILYISKLQPCFINTSSYEHHMMCVSEKVGFPMSNVNCSQVSFDSVDISREESGKIRNMISRIAKMDTKDLPGRVEPGSYLSREGWETVQELDSIFLDKMPAMDFYEQLKPVVAIGSNDKSYALLEIRRQSSIDFNSTFYVGGGPTDFHVLDLLKDGGGVALSFNGCGNAVRNSNVAVISSDASVVSVLAAEFYNEGREAVMHLADNWNREYIQSKEGPDRNLLINLLNSFPKKLPEVVNIDDDNVSEIAERSEAYRKKFYQDRAAYDR